MDAALATDRELLLAAARRHETDLPTEALFGLVIAAGELVEPGTLPPDIDIDIDLGTADGAPDDLLALVRAVRGRLQHHAATAAAGAAEAFRCARAARELAAVEVALSAEPAQ